MSTQAHYENHLARFYSWMFGNFADKAEEQKAFFSKHEITPQTNGIAIDLGAGSGFQSIPLTQLGFEVTAIDFSQVLIEELQKHAEERHLKVHTVIDDLLRFPQYLKEAPELILCMGDTLTHLPSWETVQDLIAKAYLHLAKGGHFILSYRDLSHELQGVDRFIPVKNDNDMILTCYLEYEPDYVKVFDILHEKQEGQWQQKISFYHKLKIPLEKLMEELKKVGFQLEATETQRGMHYLIAVK
jgi:SAM-dependent methyltransferase